MDEDMGDRVAELDALREGNRVLLQELQTQGAQMDPNGMLGLRIHVLLEMFLTSEERVKFELVYETQVKNQIEIALAEVKKSKEEQESLARRRELLEGIPENGYKPNLRVEGR